MSDDCVVDASVGIKLFVAEPDSAKADALFARLAEERPATFYVPDLFFVECANILWKYVRRFGYPTANARQDVADLLRLRLQTISTADLLKPALELALAYDLTVYDACYAALSQAIDRPLITADAALQRKLSGSPITVLAL